jgi:ATP-dependent DNA helicase RecG
MERSQAELIELVDRLRAEPEETEWLEFKEAKNDFHFDELGKYFSALSNEARLAGRECGWLAFGVTNEPPRQVVGSGYRSQAPGLEKLKQQVAKFINYQLTFAAIYEVSCAAKRVILFQIPAAPVGIPVTWHGIAYGRIRDSLGPLSLHKIDAIRGGAGIEDWSAQPCAGATLADLDRAAVVFARTQYLQKHQALAAEVAQWSDEAFLTKAKVYVAGHVTRAAIVLLGRSESERFLSPAVASITWVLKGQQGAELDYQHFGPPLILAVGEVFSKVRNLTYRYMPDDTLFPKEVSQYDPWVLREIDTAQCDRPSGLR